MQFIDYDSGQRQGRPVICEINDHYCYSVISHAPNADGYVRKAFMVNGKKILKMYHRYAWERDRGVIPEGFEIDHICRNRKCCNVNHLQLITRSEHAAKTNRERKGIKFGPRRNKSTKRTQTNSSFSPVSTV